MPSSLPSEYLPSLAFALSFQVTGVTLMHLEWDQYVQLHHVHLLLIYVVLLYSQTLICIRIDFFLLWRDTPFFLKVLRERVKQLLMQELRELTVTRDFSLVPFQFIFSFSAPC